MYLGVWAPHWCPSIWAPFVRKYLGSKLVRLSQMRDPAGSPAAAQAGARAGRAVWAARAAAARTLLCHGAPGQALNMRKQSCGRTALIQPTTGAIAKITHDQPPCAPHPQPPTRMQPPDSVLFFPGLSVNLWAVQHLNVCKHIHQY